ANDKHRWVSLRIVRRGLALIAPVWPAEIARMRLSGRAHRAEAFLVALQFFQRGEQGPGFGRVAAQPQHAAAAADRRLECEDRLGRLGAGALDQARRRALRIEPERR